MCDRTLLWLPRPQKSLKTVTPKMTMTAQREQNLCFWDHSRGDTLFIVEGQNSLYLCSYTCIEYLMRV